MSNDKAKKAVGCAAADLIENNMKVGLGTGSTAYFFIERLIERTKQGLKISAVATSRRSSKQAKKGGIQIIEPNDLLTLDVDVDGADEIDPEMRMIKGGGGALLKEKIIASASKEMIIVIDESKLVDRLGKHVIPIEIIPFAFNATITRLEEKGYKGRLRSGEDGKVYVTDNENYIFDVQLPKPTDTPEKIEREIIDIAGVVETGFFLNLASKVIIGYHDGRIEMK